MTETIRRAPDEVRTAVAWLLRAAEPGTGMLADFVASVGPEAAVDALIGGDATPGMLTLTGMGHRGRLDELAARVDQDLRSAEVTATRLVVPGDAEWPTLLDGVRWPLSRAPLGLWVRGTANLAALSSRSVAIVGSRASTAYGEHVAGELAHGLAGTHLRTVFAGGAFGIDAAAHRGALAAQGETVAVLACGVDRAYPAAHNALFGRIIDDGGLLVSEYPPGAAPLRHRFLSRNRLVGALAQGLVVVEAAARSGSAAAAARANEIGRPVMAVPGPVTSQMSVGCHMLLRDGAQLVTSAADVDRTITAGV